MTYTEPPAGSPSGAYYFGAAPLRTPHLLTHFAGTETERFNGHMEGAVMSGVRAAREVLKRLGPVPAAAAAAEHAS